MTMIHTTRHAVRRARRAWSEMAYAQRRSFELMCLIPDEPMAPTRAASSVDD